MSFDDGSLTEGVVVVVGNTNVIVVVILTEFGMTVIGVFDD